MQFRSLPTAIDTDERRAVVRRLTDALYEYLTLDVTEMERHATMQAEARKPKMEDLVGLQDSIEQARMRLADAEVRLERAIADSPEAMEGTLRVQFGMMWIDPLTEHIKQLEVMLSKVQEQLEAVPQAPLGEGTIEG
jgi:hypothetical protein